MSDKSSKKNNSHRTVPKWSVVKFINEDAVEAVPERWYVWKEDECYWPPPNCSRKKIMELITGGDEPESNWKRYPATVLGTYEDLATAHRKADRAKNTSDLSSGNEEWRKKPSRSGVRKEKKESRRKLSDIQSESDDSAGQYSDSDPNEYPSTKGLATQKIKRRGGKSLGEISDDGVKKMDEKLVMKSVNNELVNNSFKDCDNGDRARTCDMGSTMKSSDNNPTKNEVKNFEFQKQVLKEIHVIHLKLNDIMENVSLLIKNKRSENEPKLPANEIPDIVHSFPLTEKTLNEVEHWLKLDATNKKILAQELSHIGGTDTKEVVRRIMYRVFTNELGDIYSWEGAKKKKTFKELTISSTILSAVRMNKAAAAATETEVINFIKSWLVRCKERINNLKTRNKTNGNRVNGNGEEIDVRAGASTETDQEMAKEDQPIESQK